VTVDGGLAPQLVVQRDVLQRHRGLLRQVAEQVLLVGREGRAAPHDGQHLGRGRPRAARQRLRHRGLVPARHDAQRARPAGCILGGGDDRGCVLAVRDDASHQLRAAVARVERLHRRTHHDVGERGAVELGRERLADAVDRAVEPLVLGGQLVEPADRFAHPHPPVGGEHCEQREQRQHQQQRERPAGARHRDQQPDRGQARVDQVHVADHPQLHRGCDAAAQRLAGGRDQQVGRALRGERQRQHAGGRELRLGRAEEGEDQCGPDGVPRVAEAGQDALRPVDGVGRDERERHARGDDRGRQQEQHRHEHELGRDRRAGAEVEVHA